MNVDKMKPYIVCGGSTGRAVVFGWCEAMPETGKPVMLYNARMVLRWDESCGGLLGFAANGPTQGDNRITFAAEMVADEIVHQVISVSDKAVENINKWPGYVG